MYFAKCKHKPYNFFGIYVFHVRFNKFKMMKYVVFSLSKHNILIYIYFML